LAGLGWRALLNVVHHCAKAINRAREATGPPPGLMPIVDVTYLEWACDVLRDNSLL